VHSESFPGWDSFGSFTAHFRFLREHEGKIDRVALVTDSPIAGAAEAKVKLFISAHIKPFRFADYNLALAWLKAPRESMNRPTDPKARDANVASSDDTTVSARFVGVGGD